MIKVQEELAKKAHAEEIAIACSKKACWCCFWLSQHLQLKVTPLGTHGVIYPWDPPIVGINEEVLQELEDALWKELRNIVENPPKTHFFTRHSTPASSIKIGDDEDDLGDDQDI